MLQKISFIRGVKQRSKRFYCSTVKYANHACIAASFRGNPVNLDFSSSNHHCCRRGGEKKPENKDAQIPL